MKPDIIIPTCRKFKEAVHFYSEVRLTSDYCRVILSQVPNGSCGHNKNNGLDRSTTPIIITIDDDISGFFEGWDQELIKPFKHPDVVMVSARLMDPDGGLAVMTGGNSNIKKDTVRARYRNLPGAAVAFRNDGLRYDEAYLGSGWEDTDFCRQLRDKYPKGRFVIANRCKLTHAHEKKNQLENWEKNKAYYHKKWSKA